MRGSRKFCQRGPNTDNVFFFFFFFLVDGMERIEKPLKWAFRWHADNGPTSNAGSVSLCFFRGSGPELLRNSIFL